MLSLFVVAFPMLQACMLLAGLSVTFIIVLVCIDPHQHAVPEVGFKKLFFDDDKFFRSFVSFRNDKKAATSYLDRFQTGFLPPVISQWCW